MKHAVITFKSPLDTPEFECHVEKFETAGVYLNKALFPGWTSIEAFIEWVTPAFTAVGKVVDTVIYISCPVCNSGYIVNNGEEWGCLDCGSSFSEPVRVGG